MIGMKNGHELMSLGAFRLSVQMSLSIHVSVLDE